VLLSVALVFCFGLAFLAGRAGLAPIVGAFAAGLVLDEVHYRELRTRKGETRSMDELLQPIATFLVPVFFVLMGIRVDLNAFAAPGVLGFAAALTLVAVLGKQACSLGVLEQGCDRLAVGLGMIPRGEVGLIFAGIGATLTIAGERVVDGAVFSAVVVMVALTTLVTPPLLVWRLRQLDARTAKRQAT
jgi:Kef-type K+ transport system membrane component KefB